MAIFKADLKSAEICIEPIAMLELPDRCSMDAVCAVEPALKLIVFSFKRLATFVHWPSQSYLEMSMGPEDGSDFVCDDPPDVDIDIQLVFTEYEA